ncbi:MAG: GDSL family lipase, partial [Aristaeellaceae bacterium]
MTTIFWAGDSTVKQNSIETYPQTGIGQVFDRFVRRYEVQVENYAENGRSTRQFIDEGRLAVIYDRITEGDFLFIQFGHNDEKVQDPARYTDPDTDFPVNLGKFVNVARNKKATPVFITPLTRYGG